MEDPEQAAPATQTEVDAAREPEGSTGASSTKSAAAAPAKPPRTRVSATFQALIAGFVLLVLLLIFILENTEDVKINFLGAKGHISLGVALLLAAAGGALIVATVGVARIGQLRLHERRQRRRP
jgi:uncharacterized integral membrane protein